MPTESELRAALRSGNEDSSPTLDAEAIIRKARRRRTPKQVLVGSATALAVVAVVFVGANSLPALIGGGATSSGSLADSSVAPESAAGGRDASQATGDAPTPLAPHEVNRCGAPVATLPVSTSPLALTLQFPGEASADGGTVLGTATLTNPIAEHVVVTVSAAPSATVAQDGITRWQTQSLAASTGQLIDLAPGESTTFGVEVNLVACSSADEQAGTSDQTLPPLPPGGYQVSVVLQLDGADRANPSLLQSPWTPLTLR